MPLPLADSRDVVQQVGVAKAAAQTLGPINPALAGVVEAIAPNEALAIDTPHQKFARLPARHTGVERLAHVGAMANAHTLGKSDLPVPAPSGKLAAVL